MSILVILAIGAVVIVGYHMVREGVIDAELEQRYRDMISEAKAKLSGPNLVDLTDNLKRLTEEARYAPEMLALKPRIAKRMVMTTAIQTIGMSIEMQNMFGR